MGRPKRWTFHQAGNGYVEVRFHSWVYFHDYVSKVLLDYSHYIFRGQERCEWKLTSALDRRLSGLDNILGATRSADHLKAFRAAARGRRGRNPEILQSDDDWWALGQHHGLETPLLDWTESPFVALFFAFESSKESENGHRAVFGLSRTWAERASRPFRPETGTKEPVAPLRVVTPQVDDNSRLVSQRGLFTRAPDGMSVEEWVQAAYTPKDKGWPLIKMVFPDSGRDDCLRALNRMNINHLTLFPDLEGAAKYCRTALEIARC